MAVICHVIDARKTAFLPEKSAAWSIRPLDSNAGVDCLGPLVLACHADAQPGPRVSLAGLRAELTPRQGRVTVGFAAHSTAAGADSEIVGFALVLEARGRRGRRFSLAWLLVHPAARRQGVATTLLSAAFAHVSSHGGAKIHVETLSSWPNAVAFWRSLTSRAGRAP